ncbi:MAG: hypothetical protein ABIR81_07255 [Ginsengibacter sp.]
MNYIKWLGLGACVALFVTCFANWTYHDDIHKFFTGFYSEKNAYGKPGIFLCFFAVMSAALILLQKIWAKRLHLFLAALFVGYAIKTFTLYASCYNAYCPQKQFGIYLMLVSTIIILLAAVIPKMELKANNQSI